MTLPIERFAELLDAYGASIERWPATQADAAHQLLARSQEAQRLLREAKEVDALLQAPEPVAPSPWLRQRVLQGVAARPRRRGLAGAWNDLLMELGGWRMAAPALAAALCLGVALGLGAGLDEVEQQSAELTALLQFDHDDLEY